MKETIKNLKMVWRFGGEYKKNVIMFTLMSMTFIVLNIITPIVGAKQLVYISGGLYKELIAASLIILMFAIIRALNHVILRKNTQVFFRGTEKKIQIAAAKEILKIKVSDLDKTSTGTFIQRIGNDTGELSRIFTTGMGKLTQILTNIGIFCTIFIYSKIAFLYFLIGSTIMTLLHLKKVRCVNEKDKIYRKQREKTGGLLTELVRGVRDIKMLHAKSSFIKKIEENIDELTNCQFNIRNYEMQYNAIIDGLHGLVEFLLVVLLVILITKSNLTLATAIIIYNFKDRVFYNLMDALGELLTEIKNFNLSSNRVFSLLDGDEFTKESFGTEHIDNIKGNFEFKNVSFSYGKNKVLNDLSFKIKENETVAFVGKSGAGKTTIFNLLCKLYEVKEGQILIDNKDINTLDEYSIRNNITIISQNPYIFNLSIKDNLKLVKSNLTNKEMKRACKLACLDEFIESLPDKYDTIVGEGGVTLSGGQRQRLAIARAFVQDTQIILFDEATSALDNETQNAIRQAINNMKNNYTILIIAHRLSTIIDSDRILFLEEGQIKSSGTHQQLLKKCRGYKQLYEKEIQKSD